MLTMAEVIDAHTSLKASDVMWLEHLVAEWHLLADLAFSDLILWVPDVDDNVFWACAQVRPTTGPTALEDDAEIMSNAQLDALITDQPPEVEAAILDVNAEARDRSLQVALLVPLVAGLIGIANSLRMVRLPDIEPSGSLEGMDFG